MGIADEIRKKIKSKLVLKYCPPELQNHSVLCIICNSTSIISGNFCFFIPDEGYVCYSCGKNFAPEIAIALSTIDNSSSKKPDSMVGISSRDILSSQEWLDIHDNLETLQKVTMELSKGLSRGIVEAPIGHIGLLHYAKDIVRPVKKDSESDKNYEMRVKTYRIRKIFEKLKKETSDRIELLQKYFIKLGMSIPKDAEKR